MTPDVKAAVRVVGTQRRLARLTGIPQSTISRVLSGGLKLSPENAQKVQDVLRNPSVLYESTQRAALLLAIKHCHRALREAKLALKLYDDEQTGETPPGWKNTNT